MVWAHGLREADRGGAAGRDADVPRGDRTKATDDREEDLAGCCGPTVFAGRIAATPRGRDVDLPKGADRRRRGTRRGRSQGRGGDPRTSDAIRPRGRRCRALLEELRDDDAKTFIVVAAADGDAGSQEDDAPRRALPPLPAPPAASANYDASRGNGTEAFEGVLRDLARRVATQARRAADDGGVDGRGRDYLRALEEALGDDELVKALAAQRGGRAAIERASVPGLRRLSRRRPRLRGIIRAAAAGVRRDPSPRNFAGRRGPSTRKENQSKSISFSRVARPAGARLFSKTRASSSRSRCPWAGPPGETARRLRRSRPRSTAPRRRPRRRARLLTRRRACPPR